MAFSQPAIASFQMYTPWLLPPSVQAGQASGGSFVVVATSQIPTGDVGGGMPGFGYHQKIVVAAGLGAGTYAIPHQLTWTPTMCWVVPQIAEGTTPSLEYGWCPQDTNATNIAINVSGPGTYDVYYV